MPNRLAHESSPYLLQHASNPVDWYPWGPEALERAKAENKPMGKLSRRVMPIVSSEFTGVKCFWLSDTCSYPLPTTVLSRTFGSPRSSRRPRAVRKIFREPMQTGVVAAVRAVSGAASRAM